MLAAIEELTTCDDPIRLPSLIKRHTNLIPQILLDPYFLTNLYTKQRITFDWFLHTYLKTVLVALCHNEDYNNTFNILLTILQVNTKVLSYLFECKVLPAAYLMYLYDSVRQ